MPQLSDAAQKQGVLWGRLARDWVEFQEGIEREVWTAALDAAGVREGVAALDCGCGAGGALMEAASRKAIPSGFDPSINLLTIARERLPIADLRIAELGNIPWPNGAFEAVMANNTLQFTDDPQLGLHEMGRVAAPEGRIAVAVWDQPERCDLGRVFDAIRALFPRPPRSRGAFALSAPGRLEELFASVTVVRLARIDVVEARCEYPSPDAAVRGQMSAGATQRAVEIFGDEVVRAAVRSALEPFVVNGPVVLRNRCRIALARPLPI